jgi:hypothetical protein
MPPRQWTWAPAKPSRVPEPLKERVSARAADLIDRLSSGRRFAYRFLQTPSHDDSPCGSANGSRHQGP